ncbi:MAG: adenylate/guanylate cyclase domain-containing protein [Deltaproteobacteria bacterium]|nr:adenylate/guanylate cyclase domain-containing protein [Deltaproteobacteria bacterium]
MRRSAQSPPHHLRPNMETASLIFHILLSWALSALIIRLLFRGEQREKSPLNWHRVDRCLLLMAIWFFIWGILTLLSGVEEMLLTQRTPYYNDPFVGTVTPVFQAVFLIWLILLISGALLYRRFPDSRVFTHIVIQISAIQTAVVCYLFGHVSDTGSLLFAMLQGAFIILLFRPLMGILWMVTYTVLMMGSALAVFINEIPYAPTLSKVPFGDGRIDPVYFSSALSFQMLVFLLMLLIILFIVMRWRDREQKLTEATDILKKMFGRYLSTEVMNTLIENPSALELGGERRRVTIMMSDLRGFTALSERLDPEKVVQMLNTYFETVVNIVLKYNGTIIEIMGDALLIIFGAPQRMTDRMLRAIACAIEVQNAMTEVNSRNLENGLPSLEMGIGLNEAEVIVGNIGSSRRSKYAVVGSGVNMASRIESYSVGGQVLCSESVFEATREVLRIDGQQEVIPKGIDTPMTIYEVGGIGAPHNVYLEKEAAPLMDLPHQLPIQYTILEGKHVGKARAEGFIEKLSRQGAEVTLSEPVQILHNLEMNLKGVNKALGSRAFHAKVIRTRCKTADCHEVRFTSIPSEIAAYFEAHLQYAATSSS